MCFLLKTFVRKKKRLTSWAYKGEEKKIYRKNKIRGSETEREKESVRKKGE